jgi:two-component system KDP operon response regulator KdpE
MSQSNDVFVVEDDAVSLILVQYLLNTLGLQPQVAKTLADAKAMLKTASPKVALLDLSLPDGDGAELIPLIREQSPSTVIGVISGSILRYDEADQWNVEGTFRKPLDAHEVGAWIQKHLSRKAA